MSTDTQIHRYKYKYRYTYVTFHIILLLPSSTHLPLLMLMWPIRFVSISHWCFSFRFTISNFYQILSGLYQHQTIYVSSIGCIKVLWSSALYSTWIWICSHDTLQFYFFSFLSFYLKTIHPLFSHTFFFGCLCRRCFGYKCIRQPTLMADEWCFVIRFPVHDTTTLKFNFKPLFNFT